MMKRRILSLVTLLFVVLTLTASTATDAENYYRNNEWSKAEQLYSSLLKSAPSNRLYNHRYGVCLCEQEKDLAKAEACLLKSNKMGISLSLFYLGRTSFLQYKFTDAIAYYHDYVAKSTDKERIAIVKALLPQCEQGKTMLSRTEDVTILDRITVNRDEFFKHYRLGQEAGSLSSEASSIGEDSICDGCTIYRTERGDRTFFSVNGVNGDAELYSKSRLLNQWAEKTRLGNAVNTPYDEAYPFLMSDGVVLYFSSKGHNSLGGYDIYVTRYNAGQNTFLPPQQLGMPFNSPDDDLLFVIDEYRNIGWFASDRQCEEGKINIYTFVPNASIKLLDTSDDKVLRQAAMITGDFEDSIAVDKKEISENVLVAHKPKPQEQTIRLVLNDTLVYSRMDDFMSDDARRTYAQCLEVESSYDSVQQLVVEQRLAYGRASDAQEKGDLISGIMKLENRQLTLGEKKDKMIQSVRRLEIETILLNGGYQKAKPQASEVKMEVREETEEHHISPWESVPATMSNKKVTTPFFYNATLMSYYTQIYTPESINQMIEANKLRVRASDKLYLADYVMREYTKVEPEEGFFEKVFAYDTCFTPTLTPAQMVAKVTQYRNESSLDFVESGFKNYYALHGQNVLLLETVNNTTVHEQMSAMIDKATFAMQEAKQNLYVSENVYTTRPQNLARGNGLLNESVQYLEATSLMYLQYRYERDKKLKAEKPVPQNIENETSVVADTLTVVNEMQAALAREMVKERSVDTIVNTMAETRVMETVEPMADTIAETKVMETVEPIADTIADTIVMETVEPMADTIVETKLVETVEPEHDIAVVVQKNTTMEIHQPKTLAPVEEGDFRIQFGIFSRLLQEEDVKLSDLSYYQYSEKSLYKYFSGHYDSRQQAELGLEAVRNKGFKDAFVVQFVNGKAE